MDLSKLWICCRRAVTVSRLGVALPLVSIGVAAVTIPASAQDAPLAVQAGVVRPLDEMIVPSSEAARLDSAYDSSCMHDCVEAPGTLLQWSYGNSFGGGPQLQEPLVADRPDFTEASSTVGLRVSQFETGYTYTYDDDGGFSKQHSYPELLWRYGILANWFEVRLGWNYLHERNNGVERDGAEDLSIGTKLALTPQECLLPETGVIFQLSVPTGGRSFTDNDVLPGAAYLYSWELNDRLSLAGNTVYSRAIDEGTSNQYNEWAQSASVGLALTERVGTYAEWYGLFPEGADTARTEHYFNSGLTYLFSKDLQWDFRAGVGLNDAADDYFVGTGLVVRFP